MPRTLSRSVFGSGGLAAPLMADASAAAAVENHGFIDTLHTDRPALDREDKMGRDRWRVGAWETSTVAYEENGTEHANRGEIHAGWVLEGRAIQDVWMIPPRAERRADLPLRRLPVTGCWDGSTLRVYDPRIDAWHIFWNDPATQFYARQIGRARGDDIVQEGKLESGAVLRWSFTKIRPNS